MPKPANKTLILVRHAKSSWRYAELADADRPLNARGQRDAPIMANWLQTTRYRPDLILTSYANRALTTARFFAHALEYPLERVRISEKVYEASAAHLLTVIQSVEDECQSVMMVGHNPGFNDLAALLCGREIDNIATCAIVILNLRVSAWSQVTKRCGDVVQFQLPKQQTKKAPASRTALPADLPSPQRSDNA